MKKVSIAAASLIFLAASGTIYAEGSKIEKSTIINSSANTNAVNAAIGDGASANTGSVSIKGSEVSKSTIINSSANTNTVNAAIGDGASANTGSIDIK